MNSVSGQALAARVLELERPLLIALDVDGTLAPIVDDPAAARVPESTANALRRLVRATDVGVALVTGRDLNQLDGMVQVEGAWRSVEHGRIVIAPGEQPIVDALTPEDEGRLERFAAEVLALGGDVERKATSVAAHMRDRDLEDTTRVFAALQSLGEQLGLHMGEGRAVLEAMLGVGDKGVALRSIHARSQAKAVVFAGDDLTDFPAIEYAAAHGIGAFVASAERPQGPEKGDRLESIDEVSLMLEVLAKTLCG